MKDLLRVKQVLATTSHGKTTLGNFAKDNLTGHAKDTVAFLPKDKTMRLTVIIGLAARAIGAALSPDPAFAQYWGYNSNGGMVALLGPHHRTHHGRLYNRNSVSSGAYNRGLPPGGATPGNFSPQ